MPIYANDKQLYGCLENLFSMIREAEPNAGDALLKTGLAIRFRCSDPTADILIDGRKPPVAISYGSSKVKPQIDIALSTDTLHEILLGKLRLAKALGSGRLKPKGPVWKSFALEPILLQAQRLYPNVIEDCRAT